MDLMKRLLAFSHLLMIISDNTSAEECKQSTTCSCKTSSYTIDFSSLATGKNPRFTAQSEATTYDYEPCVALQESCSGGQVGTQQAVCQHRGVDYPAGDVDTAVIAGDPELGTLTVTYKSTDSVQTVRTSVVSLICGSTEVFEFTNEDPVQQYNFKLTSPFLCIPGGGGVPGSSGLSTGSVLLIIFFVLLVVYFVAGAVFLKFRRGAEGVEIIPNVEFWKSLPGLIRDGTLFVFRGCKKDTYYSQI